MILPNDLFKIVQEYTNCRKCKTGFIFDLPNVLINIIDTYLTSCKCTARNEFICVTCKDNHCKKCDYESSLNSCVVCKDKFNCKFCISGFVFRQCLKCGHFMCIRCSESTLKWRYRECQYRDWRYRDREYASDDTSEDDESKDEDENDHHRIYTVITVPRCGQCIKLSKYH
jgi:hypothetical protein